MAATPYKATVEVQGASGAVYNFNMSASDVAEAKWTDDDTGLSFIQVPERAWIKDIVLSAAGVDTPKIALTANGRDTGRKWRGASLLASIPLPRLASAVGPIAPNTALQFVQKA